MKLLEIIPAKATSKSVVEKMVDVGEKILGKGVVFAKDTPNFIANHVGLFGVVQLIRALESGAYTIEEVVEQFFRMLRQPGVAMEAAVADAPFEAKRAVVLVAGGEPDERRAGLLGPAPLLGEARVCR